MNHEVTCSQCHQLFECLCVMGAAAHRRRESKGWPDRCGSCEREEQESWFAYLKTNPEANRPEKVGDLR